MTASELQDLLMRTLVREVGGTQRRWRIVVGPVCVRDAATHPHCNWSADLSGSPRELAEARRLLDRMLLAHPFVAAG